MTIASQTLTRIVDEKLEDPKWVKVLIDIKRRLANSYYDQKYVDIIFQKWDRFSVSFYDAYAFIQAWSMFQLAQVVMTEIRFGCKPLSDVLFVDNNKMLAMLEPDITASVTSGTDDCDGILRVNYPFEMDMINSVTGEKKTKIAKGSYPLEIGYTNPEVTLLHLRGERKLARWPYESESIYLLDFMGPFYLNVPYKERHI